MHTAADEVMQHTDRSYPMTVMMLLVGAIALASNVSVQAHEFDFEMLPGSEAMTLQQAQSSNAWQSGHGVASYAYDGRDRWLRYPLPPIIGTHVFSIMNPWLSRFDVYVVNGDGDASEKYELGSRRPLSDRPLIATSFDVPVGPDARHVYIYDYGQGVAYFPIDLHSPADYSGFNIRLSVFQGIYYGIVLIMVLYNFVVYIGTRRREYLVYSTYAITLTVLLSAMDGTASIFLLAQTPWLLPWLITAVWGATLMQRLYFMRLFLQLRGDGWQRGLLALSALIGISMIFSWAFPSPDSYNFRTLVSIVAMMAFVLIGVYAVKHAKPNSLVFSAANSMLVIGGFIHTGSHYNLIEPSLITQHAIHVGSALELALLAVALGRRLRQTEQARFKAYRRSLELSRHNKELRTAQALAEEHRQLQRSLQQAQKLRTIGQLAGGFAHDFNNILASILGFAELSQQPAVLADRAKLMHYLGEIRNSGERGAELVQQLLVYSRGTPTRPQRLDLTRAVEQAGALLRGSLPATVDLNSRVTDADLHLNIDPEQLQQVLVNLCINAAEAMQDRGTINIEVGMAQVDEHRCSSCVSRFSGEYAAIRIEDSGPGIHGNAQEIFTPFQSSKPAGQGIGLGLSVVHGIVHEYGGHIHASNSSVGGARFVVYLPLDTGKPVPASPGKRILLLEDDASVSSYMTALLSAEVFTTTVANLPTEALELFMADPDAFDLVITDYLMPQGTGLEFAEDVHALRPDLPVILYTGDARSLNETQVRSASIAAIFEKPLNADALLAKVRGLLSAGRP